MNNKPIFLVLEGLDGTGKSSVGRILADKFNFEFIDSLLEPFNKRYKEFHQTLDSYSFYIFMLAHLNYTSNKVKELMDTGRGVVISRYYPTTICYAVANATIKETSFPSGNGIDPLALGLVRPTHMFYLYADENERKRRLGLNNPANYGDNLTLNVNYRNILDKEFSKFPMVKIDTTSIDCIQVANKISDTIL